MSVRRAGYWLLAVSCLLAWPGCARPMLNWTTAGGPPFTPPQIERPPKNEGQLSLARLAERSGQNDQAQRMYQSLIEKQPDDPMPFQRLGVIAARDKKWRLAEQYFDQAYSLGPPSAELLSDMGYLYYLQNRPKEAENILRQAVAMDPENQAANNNLGLVLGELQQFDDSFSAFKHAGSEAEARANLAFVLAQQGRYDHALQNYSQALSLDPKLRPAALAMLQLAKRQPPRPPSEANEPTQTTEDSSVAPRPENLATLAPARAPSDGEDRPPSPANFPNPAAAPARVARVESKPAIREQRAAENQVAVASWQQEPAAPKPPQKPAATTAADVALSQRSTNDNCTDLVTKEISRQEPPQLVPPKSADPLATSNPLRHHPLEVAADKLIRREPPPRPAPQIASKREPARGLAKNERPASAAAKTARPDSPHMAVPRPDARPQLASRSATQQTPELAADEAVRAAERKPPKTKPTTEKTTDEHQPTNLASRQPATIAADEFVFETLAPQLSPQPTSKVQSQPNLTSGRGTEVAADEFMLEELPPQPAPRKTAPAQPPQSVIRNQFTEIGVSEFMSEDLPLHLAPPKTGTQPAARPSTAQFTEIAADEFVCEESPKQPITQHVAKAQPAPKSSKDQQAPTASGEFVW